MGYRFRRVVIHDLLDQGAPELTRMVTGLGLKNHKIVSSLAKRGRLRDMLGCRLVRK